MDKEYLFLREEIINNYTIESNIMNFLYITISTILVFSIQQSDNIYILVSYIVLIPAYAFVWSKEYAIFRIAAYLCVFHEGAEFNWESRNQIFFKKKAKNILDFMPSYYFPFIFISTLNTFLFFYKMKWNNINIFEIIKAIFAIGIYFLFMFIIVKNRTLKTETYIKDWKKIKEQDN